MKAEQIEQARQVFRNNSDCYADTSSVGENGEHIEGAVVQAITEETFIALLSSLEKNILMEFVSAGQIEKRLEHKDGMRWSTRADFRN